MARQLKKLGSRPVAKDLKPGRHSDGGGLYLIVDESQAKRWLFMYRQGNRRREMGLGGTIAVSANEARILADQARRQLQKGLDPITEKKRERLERQRLFELQRTLDEGAWTARPLTKATKSKGDAASKRRGQNKKQGSQSEDFGTNAVLTTSMATPTATPNYSDTSYTSKSSTCNGG